MLRFDWEPLQDWERVRTDWQSLEALSPSNVFLSWSWVQTWHNVYQAADFVCRVFDQAKLVGIGLWARKHHDRPLGLNVCTLHLQHSGIDRLDQIWPEYNEMLCLPEYRQAVHAQLLSHIPKTLNVNEIDLGVCEADVAQWALQESSKQWLSEERWRSVSIAAVIQGFSSIEAYLESLSSSFRYQLRRTEKGLVKLGPIQLEFAQTANQCKDWLKEDSQWHKAQWGEDSGFHNPDFERFHMAWIDQGYEQGLVHVVRLLAGQECVSGAYLFHYQDTLYFYLGFARQDWGAKVKTGLYLHYILIRYCIEQGIAVYDFMGGDYPYKRKFGQPVKTLVRCRFKPLTLKNIVEKNLKRVKRLLKKA